MPTYIALANGVRFFLIVVAGFGSFRTTPNTICDSVDLQTPLFIENREYKRSEIHDRYGGNRQGGISPSGKHPYIFIFTGAAGYQHGYKDTWENRNVFSYTGEGQIGDMEFKRGNLALQEHVTEGKRVFLFQQTRKGFVTFVSELVLMDFDYELIPDRNNDERRGIKFFFQRVGTQLDYNLSNFTMAGDTKLDILKPNVIERSGLVLSRVGQGAYRKSIINRWENKCAVTGFRDSRVLIASHIHPWKDATSEERLDVNNGILLSPTYDALFDRHLITFESSGGIVLSKSIDYDEYRKLGVSGRERIIRLNSDNIYYLEKHQEVFEARERGR